MAVPSGWFEWTRTKAGMKALLFERERRAGAGRSRGGRGQRVATAVFLALIVAGIVANIAVQPT